MGLPGLLFKAIYIGLTDISSNEEVFNDAAPLYNEALKKSGYTYVAMYLVDRKTAPAASSGRQKRKRKRKITWFTPPFSKSKATDVARKFLRLIDRHFPEGSKLHCIFNRSKVKVIAVRPMWGQSWSGTMRPSQMAALPSEPHRGRNATAGYRTSVLPVTLCTEQL